MHNFTWAPVDLAHQLAGEQDENFDAELSRITDRRADAMRKNAVAGGWQALSNLAEPLADRMSQRGNLENMIREALSCGPLQSGQTLLGMINACIDDAAEAAARDEMAQAQRKHIGGFDFAALRAADALLQASKNVDAAVRAFKESQVAK